MMATSPPPTAPIPVAKRRSVADFPPEVRAIAERFRVAHLLPEILDFTEQIFPGPVAVMVEWDPEIPDDPHIVFEVKATGTIAEILDREGEWHRKVLDCAKPESYVISITIIPTLVDDP